ncbi:sporulation protein [Kitasatospora sp. NPDC054939]
MVFNRLLGALGVGGPGVRTVLDTPVVRPGGAVEGRVELAGGSRGCEVRAVALHLAARVDDDCVETGPGGLTPFGGVLAAGPLALAPGAELAVPFSFAAPYGSPLSVFDGGPLPGVALGLRTEVEVAGGRGRGGTGLLHVSPLPVQQRILDAFRARGFRLRGAGLRPGHLHGTGQTLPFRQEFAFRPPPPYAGVCEEVGLTLLATPFRVEVVVEVDGRGSLPGRGGEPPNRHTVEHTVTEAELSERIDGWTERALRRGTRPRGPFEDRVLPFVYTFVEGGRPDGA